jgi:hypothetical protein
MSDKKDKYTSKTSVKSKAISKSDEKSKSSKRSTHKRETDKKGTDVTSNKILIDLKNKLKYLQNIRHEIKKKRILFDENRERFGLDDLSQLVKVKNTSEVKGYPFRGTKQSYDKTTRGIKFGLKVVPIETKYDKTEHPCNLENLVLKELTENVVNKNISPHIAYYLGTQKVNNKGKALKMLNLKRLEVEEKIRTHSSMLISEFVEGGSLDNWIYNIYEDDAEITDEQWKNIVFQLIYTIAIIQHYYRMMHNDFHYGNILIDDAIKPEGYFVYTIRGKTYYLKNTGIIPKLWDFEFSMVYSDKIKECYPNKFIIGPYEYDRREHKTIVDKSRLEESEDPEDLNVPYNYNEVYDVHYFLTSLLDLYISQELFDWIIQLYPREVIPEDDESTSSSSYTTSSSSSCSSSDTSNSIKDMVDDLTLSDKDSSESTSDNDNVSDDSSESTSDVSDDSSDDSSENESSEKSKVTTEPLYISEGRLINGTEELFSLPTPLDLLNDKLFESFTVKPDDFNEATAIYFNAGF